MYCSDRLFDMKIFIIFLSYILIGGCNLLPNTSSDKGIHTEVKPTLNENSIHSYARLLAEQLFSTSHSINLNYSVAVGTFLPTQGLGLTSNAQNELIGHQLQESMLTFSAQAGLDVIEYKALSKIKFSNGKDVMLSREVEHLASKIDAKYFLTGTYTELETSYIVNARLIELSTNSVIAAATDYIPINVMWSDTKVSTKDQKLYRRGY